MDSTTSKQMHSQQAFQTLSCLPPAPGRTHLPVLSDGVPHAHLPGVARGHQLVTDEEESIYGDAEAEHS